MKHKFKAIPVKSESGHFPSKLEYRYFLHLVNLQKIGDVLFFLRQVPFHLPGGVKYVCDFQIFYKNGDILFVDVKGVETDTFKIKRKIVEDVYPIKINIVTSKDF